MRYGKFLGVFAGLAVSFVATAPASAISLKECSAKYQAAKADGSLGGRNWSAFRAAECADAGKAGADLSQTAAPVSAASTTATPGTVPDALLPAVIDPKYATEKPSRARLHTCADAYRAAKKAGTLQGARWIQKGGGFYSQCSRKLKATGKG